MNSERHRVLLVCSGLREDVQPFVALALELRHRGHSCGLLANSNFEQWVDDLAPGVEFFGFEGDIESLFHSNELVDALYKGSYGSVEDQLAKALRPSNPAMYQTILDVAEEQFRADGIVTLLRPRLYSVCRAVGQHLRIPVYSAAAYPMWPTSELPMALVSTVKTTGNELIFKATLNAIWQGCSGSVNKFRAQLGLPSQVDLEVKAQPQLIMVSPSVLDRPRDWPEQVHLTGAWRMAVAPEGDLNADVVEFLDAGRPPVFVGFGCMPLRNAHGALDSCVRVIVEQLKERLVFCTGDCGVRANELGLQREDVLVVDSVSLDQLLPRCSLAVHHGSSQVVDVACRAGIPCAVFPRMGDQAFWSKWLAQKRIGPVSSSSLRVTLKELDDATLLDKVNGANMGYCRRNVTDIAKRMVSEKTGVERAADILEQYMSWQREAAAPGGDRCPFVWTADKDVANCASVECGKKFSLFTRKHHCRMCGNIYCLECLNRRRLVNYAGEQMVCQACVAQLDCVMGGEVR